MNDSKKQRNSENESIDTNSENLISDEFKQEETKKDNYDRDEKANSDYFHEENDDDAHYDQDPELIDDSEE